MTLSGEGLGYVKINMNCRHNLTALQNHDSAACFRSDQDEHFITMIVMIVIY